MDKERKNQIQSAYRTMLAHNLWRRGKVEDLCFTPEEIGDSIDTLCGVAIDYIALEAGNGVTIAAAKLCESVNDMLHYENRRLKAILASHGIRYKRR